MMSSGTIEYGRESVLEKFSEISDSDQSPPADAATPDHSDLHKDHLVQTL